MYSYAVEHSVRMPRIAYRVNLQYAQQNTGKRWPNSWYASSQWRLPLEEASTACSRTETREHRHSFRPTFTAVPARQLQRQRFTTTSIQVLCIPLLLQWARDMDIATHTKGTAASLLVECGGIQQHIRARLKYDSAGMQRFGFASLSRCCRELG